VLTPKFKVEFLEEAYQFLESLDEKVTIKSFTISQKQGSQTTKSYSKN